MDHDQQDFKNQLAKFGKILEETRELSAQRMKPQPTQLPQNITRKLPPLVIPSQPANHIVISLMDATERELMVKYLTQYKKTGSDWDTFKNKIPEKLLEKWKFVLDACRENGFIAPKVYNEKIIWSQILGFKRNYKNADKCTLCSCNHKDGNCKGKLIYKNQQRMFQQCWSAT